MLHQQTPEPVAPAPLGHGQPADPVFGSVRPTWQKSIPPTNGAPVGPSPSRTQKAVALPMYLGIP